MDSSAEDTRTEGTSAPQPDWSDIRSADVADIAEKLTGKRSHMSSAIRLIEGGVLAGPALTIRMVRDENTPAMTLGLAVVRAIESARPSTVLVMVVEDGADFAAFGATLGKLMKVRNLAGLVVDGAVRDRQALRELQLPTFARGTAAGSAGGHYRLDALDEPLSCGGVEVCPGDLIVGDEDGVAVVPKALLEQVVAAGRKAQAEETELLARIEAAGSYLKLSSANPGAPE
jgi:4-hydroxy-4-methyl-2-oxoglutarate aldolase